MNAVLKYTLGRIGLLVGVLLILLPVPGIDFILKLVIAFVASFALSWFLLRRWRDEMAHELAASSARRRAKKERLRAALAGEDEPGGGHSRQGPEEPSR